MSGGLGINLRLAMGRNGSISFEPEALTLFSAMTVQPSPVRKVAINTLIKALKACGAWQKFDRFWMLAAHTPQAALLNWKAPGTDNLALTVSGVPQSFPYWDKDRGFNGHGVNTVQLQNNVTFATLDADSGSNFKLANAHISAWVREAQKYAPVFGAENAVTRMNLIPRNNEGTGSSGVSFGVNATAVKSFSSPSPMPLHDGWWMPVRKAADGSTRQYLYRNGAPFVDNDGVPADGGFDDASYPVVATKFRGIKSNAESTAKLSLMTIGSDITPQASDAHAAIAAYMTGVGVIKPPIASSWSYDFLSNPSIYSLTGDFYPTANFTEPTIFPDEDGLLRSTVPGEAPFGGFRRVYNLVRDSELPATQTITVEVGREYVLAFTGTGSIVLSGAGALTLNGQGAAIRVAAAKFAASTTSLTFTVSGDVRRAQVEDVTNKLNQNPSEYVSRGELPDPYHGCGIDGIRYFTTANGNTVAAEVVTEATGSALTTLKGLQIMPATTNRCLQSSNFGATWVATGTLSYTHNAKHCGDVSIGLLGDIDAVVASNYAQNIAFAATYGNFMRGISLLIAQGDSSSSVIVLRDTTASADRLLAAVTWSGGLPIVTMTTGAFQRYYALGNGVFRLEFVTTTVTTANTNSLRIYPASDSALTGTSTGEIYAGGVQAEDFDFCSMLVPTTTAVVSRSEQNLTSSDIKFGGNNGVNDSEGTVKAEVLFETNDYSNISIQQYVWNIKDSLTNSRHMGVRYPSKAFDAQCLDDGVQQNTPANLGTIPEDVVTRICYAYKGTGSAGKITGGSLVPITVGTLPLGLNLFVIGSGGGPDHALNGYLRSFSYQPNRISDAEINAYVV